MSTPDKPVTSRADTLFKMASASTFRRNVSWQLLGSALQTVLSALVLLVLGRYLEPDGFGRYSIVLGFVTVAGLMIEPRMQDLAARVFWNFESGTSDNTAHRDTFLNFLAFEAAAKLLPMVAILLLAYPLAGLANLPSGGPQLLVIAAIGNYLGKLGYGLSTGMLRVLGRSDYLTYCATGELLARIIVLAALAYLGLLSVTTGVIALGITLTASNLIQLLVVTRRLGSLRPALHAWRPGRVLRSLSEHKRLVFSNMGMSTADLMSKDLDITLLSPLMPASTIGIYKMAKNIALLTWRAVDPFYYALMPELSRRIMLRDYYGARTLIRRSIAGLGLFSIFLAACAYAMTSLFWAELFGPTYAGISGLLGWMLVGIVSSAPFVWSHPLSVALDRSDVALAGSVIGSAAGLIAFYALVRAYGIQGAAVSWSLTFLATFAFTAMFAHRLLSRRVAELGPRGNQF